eukprot:Pgem_evm1s5646
MLIKKNSISHQSSDQSSCPSNAYHALIKPLCDNKLLWNVLFLDSTFFRNLYLECITMFHNCSMNNNNNNNNNNNVVENKISMTSLATKEHIETYILTSLINLSRCSVGLNYLHIFVNHYLNVLTRRVCNEHSNGNSDEFFSAESVGILLYEIGNT